MVNYIKSEFKRVMYSKNTKYSFIICIICLVIGVWNLIFFPKSILGSSYMFRSAYADGMLPLLCVINSIVVSIPFSYSYLSEHQSNFDTYMKLRVGKFKYIIGKFIINGFVGGLVLFIPCLIFYIGLVIIRGFSPYDIEAIVLGGCFEGLYAVSPILYFSLQIFMAFVYGVTFSTFSLGVSIYIKNIYLSILCPFLFSVMSGMFLTNFNDNLYTQIIYDLSRGVNLPLWPRLLYAFIIIVVSISMFMAKYNREE